MLFEILLPPVLCSNAGDQGQKTISPQRREVRKGLLIFTDPAREMQDRYTTMPCGAVYCAIVLSGTALKHVS